MNLKLFLLVIFLSIFSLKSINAQTSHRNDRLSSFLEKYPYFKDKIDDFLFVYKGSTGATPETIEHHFDVYQKDFVYDKNISVKINKEQIPGRIVYLLFPLTNLEAEGHDSNGIPIDIIWSSTISEIKCLVQTFQPPNNQRIVSMSELTLINSK